MDVENIGNFLLELRKEKGLTQKEIAILCSVSNQAVSKWERGESIPDIEILDRLSKLYDLTINEIINGRRDTIDMFDRYRKSNIVMISVSLLVFLSYAFNYVNLEYSMFGNYSSFVLKGFELIFNGISGWFVYIVWMIFSILISQLIINVFVFTKVMNRTTIVYLYQLLSLVIIIIISIGNIFDELHYAFPQIIILICSIINVLLLLRESDKCPFFKKLNEYSVMKRSKNVSAELILDKTRKNTVFVNISKITILLVTVLFFLQTLFGVLMTLYSLSDPNTYMDFDGYTFSVFLSIPIIFVVSFKFLGSIYTKSVLLCDLLVLFIGLLAMIVIHLAKYPDISIIESVLPMLIVLGVPALFLLVSYHNIDTMKYQV